MGLLRVVVADDHPVVRGGLCALLATLDGVEVVGEAATGAAAVRECGMSRPDVVVMDLRMGDSDGVEATRAITTAFPGTAVLVLTMFQEDEMVSAALAAGARGYLLKGAEPVEIERALRAVADGAVVLAPQVAGSVMGRLAPASRRPAFPHLTPREAEVLALMARGATNAAISERLRIAPKTVGNHVSALFAKLGVTTRAEAIVLARDAGIGALDGA